MRRIKKYNVVGRHELLRSLNAVLEYSSEHDGKLVDKAGLRSAIERYRNVVRDSGFFRERITTQHDMCVFARGYRVAYVKWPQQERS